ncbi:MAG: 4-hydroxythreonine-4-phosphate dehydrogenase PdxA, partial [Sphingomonadaceae bacterium]
MTDSLPERPLAVSLGDLAGIGPEIIAGAWLQRKAQNLPPFLVVGGATALNQMATQTGIDLPLRMISTIDEASSVFEYALPVLDVDDAPWTPGKPDSKSANIALSSLGDATELALEGRVSALVTAPVSKASLMQIGFNHPGQTEFLASACDISDGDAVMMLAGPSLRAIPVTVHIPFAQITRRLTSAMIERRARIAAMGLIRDFGISTPHLAFAGLNPHAGESGKMGNEESRIIRPAMEALEVEGIHVSGPYPPDALFTQHIRSGYDAAICMYHDQALIPVKALDFD